MKKLLKITLSLLCVLAMTGCGSKENENDTNSKKETTTQKNEEKKEKSSYYDDYSEEYKLRLSGYSIFVPKDTYGNYELNTDTFIMKTKGDNELKVLITTIGYVGTDAKNIDLSMIDKESEYCREEALMSMYDYNTTKLDASKPDTKVTISKYKAALYNSNKLIIENSDEATNYVVYRFFLLNSDDEKDMCEIIVCSDDYEEKDLKNIAEELIGQIHETK